MLGLGCSPRKPVSGTPPEQGWTYEVSSGPDARELSVVASFPFGSNPELSVDEGAEPFVLDVAVDNGRDWQMVVPAGRSWNAPSCRARNCQIRYRFLLAEASKALADFDVALANESVYVAPPSTWLLRPLTGPARWPYRFRVTTPPGIAFVSGVRQSRSDPNTYGADIADLPAAPYSAFGTLRRSRVESVGGFVDVAIAPGNVKAGERALFRWIETSARVVAGYYGRFPVERVLLLVLPSDGAGPGYGKTLGNGGASIVVPIGRRTDEPKLRDDWMLVHEMLHLGFPTLPRQHLWLEEGIATYVEPIARARGGTMSVHAVWAGLVKGLPNGLPAPGDRGLDETPTWGRTYWGGALFCLLADLEIRQRTNNRRSLDDALRAILANGGDVTVRWGLGRALETGDRATGVPVLRDLHQKMGSAPFSVDLGALWKRLGIAVRGDACEFDDGAPLAYVRRAITAGAR